MGQNNRQRRAAKQRDRARRRRRFADAPGAAPFVDGVDEVFAAGAASLLLRRALHMLVLGNETSFDLLDFQRLHARHQQGAIDEQLRAAVSATISGGWGPLDLHEVVCRKTASRAVDHLLDAVAEATARHPAARIHPQWQAQLDALGAAGRHDGASSAARAWAQRHGHDWAEALEHLLAMLTVLCSLPAVEAVLPPPGTFAARGPAVGGVDERVLRRVRALLAKAESTEHVEEADALTAKAQQLMTRYCVERAVAESADITATVPEPICRRLWLETPYVDAKSLLVEAVAEANHCRAIQSAHWGFVTVVGHPADLDVVDVLVTSLLLQATRAMTLAGTQRSAYGGSRTRSFRQSFLVSYAMRIGERLRAAATGTESAYDAETGGALLPVLAGRRERVDGKLHELFPDTVERSISASNAAGRAAGRAAADLALFDIHDAIRAG